MKSNDIHETIAQRIAEITGDTSFSLHGIKIVMGRSSKLERGKAFVTALHDYSADKLLVTEENTVTVDDLRFVFGRFNKQFESEAEKEEFYANYANCILDAYGDLTGLRPSWVEVGDAADDTFPKIIGESFVTKESTTTEAAALWLFEEYENQLKQLQKKEEPPKQHRKSRWTRFRK